MVELLKSSTTKSVVSIIFPIFNSEKFLRKSLESILTQTYGNFEIIAINDGSTDKSRDVLLSYKDPRIKYIEHKNNRGLVATLNEGFALAKGKYIARMDPDDVCHKDRFKKQVKFLNDNTDIDVVGSWINIFGLYNYVWRVHQTHAYIDAKLIFETPLAHPSVMMRRGSILRSEIKFEEKYYAAEDYMFWSKLSKFGLKFSNIQESLLDYRTHKSQVGEAKQLQQQNSSMLVREYNIRRLGLRPNRSEINVHQKLSSWEPLDGFKEVLVAGRWLSKLLRANHTASEYNHNALSRVIGERWATICYITGKSYPLRSLYLITRPDLLPLSLMVLSLRYQGKLYENK